MISNSNYNNYFLPEFSDEYHEFSYLWEVPGEEKLIAPFTETSTLTEECFPDIDNTSNQCTNVNTQDIIKYYHPSLPPISVAFSTPPLTKSQNTLTQLQPLRIYATSPVDEIQEVVSITQAREEDCYNESSRKEICSQKRKDLYSGNYEGDELVVAEDTFNGEKSNVQVEELSKESHSIHRYRVIGDGTTYRLKRMKTVRELLLDKQYRASMQRVGRSSTESSVSYSAAEDTKKRQTNGDVLVSISENDQNFYNNSPNVSSNLNEDMPKLRTGRVDAKEHKPRHFYIEELSIGKFVVKNSFSSRKKLNRLKVLFSKRCFVYEIVVTSNGIKRLACIIVPFRTVTAINCSDRLVILKVDSQPIIYLGKREKGAGIIAAVNVYDKTQPVDITEGEIKHCPYHKLTLGKYQADKMKLYLWHYDGRFKVLTEGPFSEDSNCGSSLLPLPDIENAGSKKKRGPYHPVLMGGSNDPGATALLSAAVVCACRTNCRSSKCSCVKAARKCNSGRSVCLCFNCDNPLNILENNGIDSMNASLDKCLLQNIYQLSDLRQYLRQSIQLRCCNFISTVNCCVPGTTQCPNVKCTAKIQYSWCCGVATDESHHPRNHCHFCRKCHFLEKRHCMQCKNCYTVKSSKGLCPSCNGVLSRVEECFTSK